MGPLPAQESVPPLEERLRGALSAPAADALEIVRGHAEREGLRAFLVGGPVRDLLLGARLNDLDLAVEGDALRLARHLASERGWGLVAHARFATATLKTPDIVVDLASARTERYPHPGQLPEVTPGATIVEDLARRDFSVNAMALALTGPERGTLIDPLQGRRDLASRTIRVLHGCSFEDDPTRCWRAVRYAGRLNFLLARGTARLLRLHLGAAAELGADRLRHEVERLLDEARPERGLQLAGRYGLLATVSPALLGDRWLGARLRELRRTDLRGQARRACAFVLLLSRVDDVDDGEGLRIAARLHAPGAWCEALTGAQAIRRLVPALTRDDLRDSDLVRLLDRISLAGVRAAALAGGPGRLRRRLERFLTRLRVVRPYMDGADLLRLGVAPGPAVGRGLALLRAARLDRQVRTRQDEEALVREAVSEGRAWDDK